MMRCDTVERLPNNVALKGVATQISTYNHSGVLLEAFYANDGNFSTDIGKGDRCAITDSSFGAWWQVDLRNRYHVVKVSITTVLDSGVF